MRARCTRCRLIRELDGDRRCAGCPYTSIAAKPIPSWTPGTCANPACGVRGYIPSGDRCQACYYYRLTRGSDRTAAMVRELRARWLRDGRLGTCPACGHDDLALDPDGHCGRCAVLRRKRSTPRRRRAYTEPR